MNNSNESPGNHITDTASVSETNKILYDRMCDLNQLRKDARAAYPQEDELALMIASIKCSSCLIDAGFICGLDAELQHTNTSVIFLLDVLLIKSDDSQTDVSVLMSAIANYLVVDIKSHQGTCNVNFFEQWKNFIISFIRNPRERNYQEKAAFDQCNIEILSAMHNSQKYQHDRNYDYLLQTVLKSGHWFSFLLYLVETNEDTVDMWAIVNPDKPAIMRKCILSMIDQGRNSTDQRLSLLMKHAIALIENGRAGLKVSWLIIRYMIRTEFTDKDVCHALTFVIELALKSGHTINDNDLLKEMPAIQDFIFLKDKYPLCMREIDTAFLKSRSDVLQIKTPPAEIEHLQGKQVIKAHESADKEPCVLFGTSMLDPYYKAFELAYRHLNDKADQYHKRDFTRFLVEHQFLITQLIEMLGVKQAFQYLGKLLIATDTIVLEQTLTAIPLLSGNAVSKIKDLLKCQPTLDLARDCTTEKLLKLIGTLQMIETECSRVVDTVNFDLFGYMPENKSIPVFISALETNVLLNAFCIHLQLEKSSINPDVFGRVVKFLPQLLYAEGYMKNDGYRKIFTEMLRRDFQGNSVVSWMHDTSQESSEGKILALHNKAIQAELQVSGINKEQALNYKTTRTFDSAELAEPTSDIFDNLLKMLRALLGHLKQNAQVKNDTLIRDINQLERNILAGVNNKPIKVDTQLSLLDSIIKKIDGELLVVFQNSRSNLGQHAGRTVNLRLAKVNSFSVQQWDKDNIETYFLGKYVGCCLAPDGGQFPALIQRRMDDAMLFHVVTENTENKPVALSWLYLATDSSQEASPLYVIANFLEISASYTKRPELRRLIVANLLAFTEQYAVDIGAAGYLINHLGYGLIPNFDCFEQKTIHPKKIGGYLNLEHNCLDLDLQYQPSTNPDKYYLASLEETIFHTFDSAKYPPSITHIPAQSAPKMTLSSQQTPLTVNEGAAEVISLLSTLISSSTSNMSQDCKESKLTVIKDWLESSQVRLEGQDKLNVLALIRDVCAIQQKNLGFFGTGSAIDFKSSIGDAGFAQLQAVNFHKNDLNSLCSPEGLSGMIGQTYNNEEQTQARP